MVEGITVSILPSLPRRLRAADDIGRVGEFAANDSLLHVQGFPEKLVSFFEPTAT